MAFDRSEWPLHIAEALRHLLEVLQSHEIQYALIGGLASGFRSRPRFTQDVDLLLQIPQIALPGILGELRARGFTFDDQQVIQQWVRDHMTVLDYHGTRVDWLKPALPLYQHVLDQARLESWLDTSIRIASAEGLILTKMIASRPQDTVDIENLVVANRGNLDLAWIAKEWNTIADGADPRFRRFQEIVDRICRSASADSAAGSPALEDA